MTFRKDSITSKEVHSEQHVVVQRNFCDSSVLEIEEYKILKSSKWTSGENKFQTNVRWNRNCQIVLQKPTIISLVDLKPLILAEVHFLFVGII